LFNPKFSQGSDIFAWVLRIDSWFILLAGFCWLFFLGDGSWMLVSFSPVDWAKLANPLLVLCAFQKVTLTSVQRVKQQQKLPPNPGLQRHGWSRSSFTPVCP
jgi:hypothetical protein